MVKFFVENGGVAMKKKAVGLTLLLLTVLYLANQTISAPIIGTISGAEWEYLTIGEKIYTIDYKAPLNRADKSTFMGIATNGSVQFRIYSIEGRDDYLYGQWEWEGYIYKRIR